MRTILHFPGIKRSVDMQRDSQPTLPRSSRKKDLSFTIAKHASCAAMRAACARLLDRAQQAGTVRPGVTAGEVIALAVGLAWAAQQPGTQPDAMARLLSTAMHGLAVPG